MYVFIEPIKMKKVYVVNTCDAWNTYESMSLVGIFTTRKKVNPVLNKLLKEKKIEWSDDECTDRFVNKLTDRELLDFLKYVFVELITLNEVQ
jgi:hypothetical protein